MAACELKVPIDIYHSLYIEGSGSFSPKPLNISLRLRFQPVGLSGQRGERNG